jgi:hypothetical protein
MSMTRGRTSRRSGQGCERVLSREAGDQLRVGGRERVHNLKSVKDGAVLHVLGQQNLSVKRLCCDQDDGIPKLEIMALSQLSAGDHMFWLCGRSIEQKSPVTCKRHRLVKRSNVLAPYDVDELAEDLAGEDEVKSGLASDNLTSDLALGRRTPIYCVDEDVRVKRVPQRATSPYLSASVIVPASKSKPCRIAPIILLWAAPHSESPAPRRGRSSTIVRLFFVTSITSP